MLNSTLGQKPPSPELGTFQPRLVIRGVDGLCGSGKSTAAAEELADRILAGERWLIAGPTAIQTRQFCADLQAALNRRSAFAGCLITQINSETVRSGADEDEQVTVAQRLAQEIAAHDTAEVFTPFRNSRGRRIARDQRVQTGRAIIITHAALFLLPHSAKPTGWHLLIDEAPAAIEAREVALPNSFLGGLHFHEREGRMRMVADTSFLRQQLERVELTRRRLRQGSRLSKLARNHAEASRLMEEATRARNATENPIREISRRVASGNWQIFVPREQVEPAGGSSIPRYKIALSPTGRSSVVMVHAIDWIGVLGEIRRRWESVVFMCANLENTFAAVTLQQQGFDIQPDPAITSRLRYTDDHPNGDGVTIYYALSQRASKRKRDAVVHGETVGQHIINAVEKLFPAENYAWTGNKDIPDSALRGERMPYVSHGLNQFQHHRNIVVLNISNLTPQASAALEEHGFTADQIRRAVMNENCYQAALRGASRNPDCTEARVIVVPDAEVAAFIAERMPGCMVGALGSPEPPVKVGGREREFASDAERKKSARMSEKVRREVSLERFRQKVVENIVGAPDHRLIHYLRLNDNDGRPMRMSGWQHVQNYLDEMFRRPAADDKESNRLVLDGALWRPDDTEPYQVVPCRWDDEERRYRTIYRGKINVIFRSSLWFDIESLGDGASGTPIQPDQFKALFPSLAMTLYSSFSHDGRHPALTRYRVVIPLSHAVGVIAYEAIYEMVVRRIEAQGWHRWKKGDTRKCRFHGIDMSKANAASIFWLPLARIGHEQHAFIEHVEGKPLDVAEWISGSVAIGQWQGDLMLPDDELISAPRVTVPRSMPTWERSSVEEKVEAAIRDYVLLPRGTQNEEINRLAWRLAGYGLTRDEIEERIREAADHSHSVADRRKQVQRVMANLNRTGKV